MNQESCEDVLSSWIPPSVTDQWVSRFCPCEACLPGLWGKEGRRRRNLSIYSHLPLAKCLLKVLSFPCSFGLCIQG